MSKTTRYFCDIDGVEFDTAKSFEKLYVDVEFEGRTFQVFCYITKLPPLESSLLTAGNREYDICQAHQKEIYAKALEGMSE